MRHICVLILTVLGLGGCATVNKVTAFLSQAKSVELRSDPPGAEISNRAGTVLGVTPLVLKGEALDKTLENNRLFVSIKKQGYAPRTLILDLAGVDAHMVTLNKHTETYFAQTTLNDFTGEINQMSRDLLQIQGLLVVQSYAQAERELENFQKKYPQVAAAFVMMASISLSRGDRDRAKGYLARANAIDPTDPVVQRMLKGVAAGGGARQ